jgi:hypothetical protein
MGQESKVLSGVLLMDVLGVGTGSGLGGGAIALSAAIGSNLAVGIGWSFCIGFAALVALAFVALRIDPEDSRPPPSS